MDVSLAIDPAPSCPGPVENHLSAYFAWDVLPLEVAIIPLKFVAVIAFRHRLKFVVDFVLDRFWPAEEFDLLSKFSPVSQVCSCAKCRARRGGDQRSEKAEVGIFLGR